MRESELWDLKLVEEIWCNKPSLKQSSGKHKYLLPSPQDTFVDLSSTARHNSPIKLMDDRYTNLFLKKPAIHMNTAYSASFFFLQHPTTPTPLVSYEN